MMDYEIDMSQVSFSFEFELPKAGLSLRSVRIEDGDPKLEFIAANSTDSPTISKEDVASVVRSVVDDKQRPDFSYVGIPPGHPFFGRQYKHCSPSWLKDTSVGELLEEADWIMKCLSIGAKTNKARTKFWAAAKTSKLEGRLGTCLDFPGNEEGGSIKMSCKLIEVAETDNCLTFIGEPKMQIISDPDPTYSSYITEMYNSVAYYDEPVLLKVPEIMKLILVVEFLIKKGVQFDREWFMAHTTNKNKPATQAVEVHEPELPQVDFEEILDHMPNRDSLTVMKKSKTGVSLSEKDKPEAKFTMSIKDYDTLYEGLNPKMPLFCGVVPDVESWTEFHAETVPWPHVWSFPLALLGIPTATGGVSTSHIPTKSHTPTANPSKSTTRQEKVKRKGPYEYSNGSLSVSGSKERTSSPGKPPKEMIPKPKVRQPPRSNVSPHTEQSSVRDAVAEMGCKDMFGYQDGDSLKMFDSDGRKLLEGETMKFAVQRPNENGEVEHSVVKMPLPPSIPGATPYNPDLSSDSGIGATPSQLSVMTDTGTVGGSDDGCFSPMSDGGVSTPRFSFCSPIGSGDES